MSKRLLLSVASVAALSALVTGASFALFTASASNNDNTFTAGTVRLGETTAFTCDVDADNLAPGDSGDCTVSITYNGSLDAFIGVDASASGGLFDTGSNPMTYTLSGGTGYDGTRYVLGEVTGGNSVTVTVEYDFPLDAGNEYQGATGEIDLSFHAVQSRNNGSGNLVPDAWN